jgi:hypothetical protein
MRKLCWSLLFLWAGFLARAQKSDSSYRPEILRTTDIELSFSYYNQSGDHSAVTGGIGTETLLVYAPNLKINHAFNQRESVSFSAGADFITSPSTDRIDFVMSSPSLHDTRTYFNAGYSYNFKGKSLTLRGGSGFSMESDYFSIPLNAGIEYSEPSKMRTYQFDIQAYIDDLRWGRLNPSHRRPVSLVYPVELRYRDWYDTYKRYSCNFRFGFTQVIDKRTLLGVFPELDYQRGLLATPYHRVYFNDSSLRVENLPGERIRVPIGLQLNRFIGGRVILKGNYQFYRDNFGIIGNAFKLETAIKITAFFSIVPSYRFYTQTGSGYFAPYRAHQTDETYYTSDWDLSSFNSHEAGLLVTYAPGAFFSRHGSIRDVNLQYSFFKRTNGLYAHYITLWVSFNFENKKKPG